MVTITPQVGNGKELEAGTYPARLVSIIHQGTGISNPKYGPQTQAIFSFVFPSEIAEGEKYAPMVKVFVSVSYGQDAQFMTVLRKLGIDTTAPFNLEDAIGKECQITCTTKDGYLNAKHKDIAPLVKGMKVPKYDTPTQFFWFDAKYETELFVDDEGKPILSENKKEQYRKTSCSDVVMTGFDCLTEKQIDKIIRSREYEWLQKNDNQSETPAISKPTKEEDDFPPF